MPLNKILVRNWHLSTQVPIISSITFDYAKFWTSIHEKVHNMVARYLRLMSLVFQKSNKIQPKTDRASFVLNISDLPDTCAAAGHGRRGSYRRSAPRRRWRWPSWPLPWAGRVPSRSETSTCRPSARCRTIPPEKQQAAGPADRLQTSTQCGWPRWWPSPPRSRFVLLSWKTWTPAKVTPGSIRGFQVG